VVVTNISGDGNMVSTTGDVPVDGGRVTVARGADDALAASQPSQTHIATTKQKPQTTWSANHSLASNNQIHSRPLLAPALAQAAASA
jgi:hypothetical protein